MTSEQQMVLTALRAAGFRQSRWGDGNVLDGCYESGSVRVFFDDGDIRVIAFDAQPGYGSVEWEATFTSGTPAHMPVYVATKHAATTKTRLKNR